MIAPGERLEKIVVGEDADVLREIGVIDAAGAQAEDLCREQRGQTDGAGRADDELR